MWLHFRENSWCLTPFYPVMTVGSVVGTTITSVGAGIVFGIIPAINASNKSNL